MYESVDRHESVVESVAPTCTPVSQTPSKLHFLKGTKLSSLCVMAICLVVGCVYGFGIIAIKLIETTPLNSAVFPI